MHPPKGRRYLFLVAGLLSIFLLGSTGSTQAQGQWNRGQVISRNSTAVGTNGFIESGYRARKGIPGNFEVLALEGKELWHYWHDNSNVASPWQRGGRVTDRATGPASLIQNKNNGNLELVVQEPDGLWHYWAAHQKPWQRGGRVTDRATGPASIRYIRDGIIGDRLDVAVQEGRDLNAYSWRIGKDTPWSYSGTIASNITGPGTMIYTSFGTVEVVVPQGQELVHYWYGQVPTPQAPPQPQPSKPSIGPRPVINVTPQGGGWFRITGRDFLANKQVYARIEPGGVIKPAGSSNSNGEIDITIPVNCVPAAELYFSAHDGRIDPDLPSFNYFSKAVLTYCR